jgi:uncharacterized membrane protein YdbT with pleckstrin-like domain
MPELVVRPTRKLVLFGYFVVLLLVAAWIAGTLMLFPLAPVFVAPAGLALLLWPLKSDIAKRFTVLKLDNGRVHYERGILSKSSRALDVASITDVQVNQSFGQRLLGVGTIRLETLGDCGHLEMPDIDGPREVADRILDAARALRGALPPRPPQA